MLSYPYHPIVTRRAYFCSEKTKMKIKMRKTRQTNRHWHLSALLFLLNILCLPALAQTGTITGKVTDARLNEPLIGASVMIEGSTTGAVTDIDGHFRIAGLKPGNYNIVASYVSYENQTIKNVSISGDKETTLNIKMRQSDISLEGVTVTARKNMESERVLQMERQNSSIAIENLGAKEMGVKGIGNVEEGVKQISGISIADAGQLIVRGLGDRYSTTTLNGLPIASPNPDNKLIPLDLFPSSTVENITVSKVYDASVFADYSGAHIDISTKENVMEDFFNVSFNVGSRLNILGKDFYNMDREGSLFKTPSMDKSVMSMGTGDFNEYVKTHNIFNTTFDVEKSTALPEFGGNIGFGKNFKIGNQTLSALASVSLSNGTTFTDDAFLKIMAATGGTQSDFDYDEYTSSLNIAALASLSMTLRKNDRVSYSFFYARNAEDSYQRREGYDAEGHNLIGSNSVTHIYTLQNHQLSGFHYFGKQWEFTWGGSYGITSSEEPDRRQVMYSKNDDGTLSLFKLNQQETMRYFGNLDENEWVGNVAMKYLWKEQNHVKVGFNYKDKTRDYAARRYYYSLGRLNPTIEDIYTPSDFLNQENLANGTLEIRQRIQSHDAYKAGMNILAGYAVADLYPLPSLLVNVGLRYEYARQWVKYAIEGEDFYQNKRELNKHDIFPTVNVKYTFNGQDNLRLSLSRTITRPSFIEMAPFIYQEAYGAQLIRGNGDLRNGYNYNFDLRYERFWKNGDMFSVTAYYKHLDQPIERVQMLQGGATIFSFQNADQGMAAGIEAEARKTLVKDLRVGANLSYMYTNVKLPEGGAYTNDKRALQGASPILLNADLTYSPRFGEDSQLSLALLYNLQGRRIHSVGVSQMGDIKQQTVHTMNFAASYAFNKHLSVNLRVEDLINRPVIFKQDLPLTGQTIEVERYKEGTRVEVGVAYKL